MSPTNTTTFVKSLHEEKQSILSSFPSSESESNINDEDSCNHATLRKILSIPDLTDEDNEVEDSTLQKGFVQDNNRCTTLTLKVPPNTLNQDLFNSQNKGEAKKSEKEKYDILDARIEKLESSMEQILQLLKNKQQHPTVSFSKTTNIIEDLDCMGSKDASSPKSPHLKVEADPETPKSSHATIEYRSYSPKFEAGLRREFQSRSRSNTIDSNSNSIDSENINPPNLSTPGSKFVSEINQTKCKNENSEVSKSFPIPTLSNKEDKSINHKGLPPRPPLSSATIAPSSDEKKVITPSSSSRKALELPQLSKTSSTWLEFLDYIKTEMLGEGLLQGTPKAPKSIKETDDRMQEFLKVPFNLEKLLFFGLSICIDSYLYVLAFLPIKFFLSVFRGIITIIHPNTKKYRFHRRHAYQLLQASIIFIVYSQILSRIRIGVLYHWIRGQAMLKLYVLIAIVEIFDRLMCAFGQDAQDSLYWNTTMNPKSKRLLVSWLVVVAYASVHSLILFVHVATLNVAMNSADQALLSLLVSGNFAEIKSTVFKKYNKMVLFNITMSDVCERFKLALFFTLILILNISQGGVTMKLAKGYGTMCIIVFIAEVIADWIKHAFITKLNFIESKTYREYALVLARDVTGMGHEGINLNHTHAVVKRVGFAQFPLVCVMARYLREAARYAWMRSDKVGMLERWYCNWKSLFSRDHVCMVGSTEWEFRHTIIVSVLVLIAYFVLLSVKIIFGYMLQREARAKLLKLDDESNNEHFDEKSSKRNEKLSTSSSHINKSKPKRQII